MSTYKVEICGVNTAQLPILKEEEKEELFKKIKAGDKASRETYIKGNLRLVLSVIKRFNNHNENVDDLFQIGCIGLMKAIDNFDTSVGVKFSTYAVPMILGEIKRFLRDDGKIKVSRQLKNEMKTLKSLQQGYYNKNGKSPKISYLAEKMGISKEHVMEILGAIDSMANIESLDNEFIPEGMHGGYYVDEEQQNVEMIDLKEAIGSLGDRERQIIVLRYFKDMTQQQIAGVLGISQVQVSRIEKKVLARMRETMEKTE